MTEFNICNYPYDKKVSLPINQEIRDELDHDDPFKNETEMVFGVKVVDFDEECTTFLLNNDITGGIAEISITNESLAISLDIMEKGGGDTEEFVVVVCLNTIKEDIENEEARNFFDEIST